MRFSAYISPYNNYQITIKINGDKYYLMIHKKGDLSYIIIHSHELYELLFQHNIIYQPHEIVTNSIGKVTYYRCKLTKKLTC